MAIVSPQRGGRRRHRPARDRPPSLGPLSIHSIHVSALEGLRPIRKGPFDRMVLAQAYAEGMTLLTANAMLAKYPGDVRKV